MNLTYWLSLTFLSILWGGSFFFVEVALTDIKPFQLVFLRVSIAAMILTGYIYLTKRKLPFPDPVWKEYLLIGFISNAIPFCLIVWGQTQITASLASILNAIVPIFTVIIAHFYTSDERMTSQKVTAILIGFLGVCVLMFPSLEDGLSGPGLGKIAIILATLCYAIGTVRSKGLRSRDPEINAAGMLISATIFVTPVAFYAEPVLSFSEIGWPAMSAAFGLAALSTALAFIIYFKILASHGATNIVLVTFLIPISGILLGYLFLDEYLSATNILGMLIIFSSLVLIDGRLLRKIKFGRHLRPQD